MSHLLIADAHHRALVLLSTATNQHFQGLQQAARHCRYVLTIKQKRRLADLDAAFAISRHITPVFVEDFVSDLSLTLTDTKAASKQPQQEQSKLLPRTSWYDLTYADDNDDDHDDDKAPMSAESEEPKDNMETLNPEDKNYGKDPQGPRGAHEGPALEGPVGAR